MNTMQNDISSRFVAARLGARPLDEFPGVLPGTLAEAYAVQTLSIERWPDRIAGWKIGGIPADLKAACGAEKLAGPIFSKFIMHALPGEDCVAPVFEGGFAAIEAEIILELATTISPTAQFDTDERIASVIKTAYVGAEIASSPLSTINVLGPYAVVSDFGNNRGLIVATEIPDWLNRLQNPLQVRTLIDDEVIGETVIPVAATGPLQAVRFLIELCRERELELPEGTMVSTGAINGVHSIDTGSQTRLEFDGFPTINVKLAAAEPQP